MSSKCNHAGCTNVFNPKEDTYFVCSLCLTPEYCSEQCRVADWVAHDCPNTVNVSNPKMGYAVPYYFEDYLTQEEISKIPLNDPIFQSYSIQCAEPNRNITNFIVPPTVDGYAVSKEDTGPIARGRNPVGSRVGAFMLKIAIGQKNYEISGTAPLDMIFKENTANPKAQAISGGGGIKNVLKGGLRRLLSHKEDSYVFWPKTESVIGKNIVVPLRGDVVIELLVSSNIVGSEWKTVDFVAAGYTLPRAGTNEVSKAARKIQQMFRTQIEMKFKGTPVSTKNLYVRRYTDYKGNGIVLTFQVGGGEEMARLVDIEFTAPVLGIESMSYDSDNSDDFVKPPPYDVTQSRFTCDPRNLNDIVGLCMAIELNMALQPDGFDPKQVEHAATVVKNYAYELQKNPKVATGRVSNEVQSAIAVSLNALYEPVGVSLVSSWERDINSMTQDKFASKVRVVIDELNKARQRNKSSRRSLGEIKGLAKLTSITKALTKYLGLHPDTPAYNTLLQEVNAAKISR